jgi:hypothetical protein
MVSQPDDENMQGRDGTVWSSYIAGRSVVGRLKTSNIMRVRPGPTAFATSRITKGSAQSSWSILFDETMLRHIRGCTIAEAHRQSGNNEWKVSRRR